MKLGPILTGPPASTDARASLVPDGRSSRWTEHRTARRRELIKTARRAIDVIGPGASMEDIAATADTSKSVYYRYFGDKTGLQRAVAEVVIAQMQQKVLGAAKAATGPREGFHSMVLAYLQMAQTSPNVYAFVTRVGIAESSAASGSSDDTLAHFLAAITAMISRPMRTFLLSPERSAGPDDAAPEYWPTAAIGMVRAVGEQWLSAPAGPDKPTEEQLARHITGWLFDGISPERTPTSTAALPSPTLPPTRAQAKDTP